MYRKVDDFLSDFKDNSNATKSYLAALTDESLSQSVADGHRTLSDSTESRSPIPTIIVELFCAA